MWMQMVLAAHLIRQKPKFSQIRGIKFTENPSSHVRAHSVAIDEAWSN